MKNEKNELIETALTMLIYEGMFLVGKWDGGGKLVQPRLFTMFEEPLFDKNGVPIMDEATGKQKKEQKFQLAPLPFTPPFLRMPNGPCCYPIPQRERNLIMLYEKVTSPQVDPL